MCTKELGRKRWDPWGCSLDSQLRLLGKLQTMERSCFFFFLKKILGFWNSSAIKALNAQSNILSVERKNQFLCAVL